MKLLISLTAVLLLSLMTLNTQAQIINKASEVRMKNQDKEAWDALEKHYREKADREKADREKADREKADREKPAREKPEREKPQRERPEREPSGSKR